MAASLGFKRRVSSNQVSLWTGSPDCQAGHEAVLGWLKQICKEFPKPARLGKRIKGNLGECIGYFIGHHSDFGIFRGFAANAMVPFEDISRPDLDVVWVFFGDTPVDDLVALQEVKTTSQSDLSYADELVDDYKKLFGSDPQTTLHVRLQTVKNKLEYEHKRADLAERLGRLEAESGQGPKTATQVKLYPTLVHELSSQNPDKKMQAVRTSITGLGWPPSRIHAWAVGLSDLDNRLLRLAHAKA
jgi:hypothetical protein